MSSTFSFSTFTVLYNNTIDQLYSYGIKITSDKSTVKDCIQEAYMDLFQNWEKIRNPKAVKYYLLKSLKRIIYRKLKAKRQSESLDFKNIKDYGFDEPFEDEIIKTENEEILADKMNQALNKLTSKQKEIIHLKFNMGFSYEEIGRLMNIHSDSAKKQTYRALGKLRGLVNENY
ncbi:MAG: sigma-70 family RNA polymerase sigma factor [Firmicutes bacterium]|nr:sigma-70 family RNA polymerase sigma factor [Bacillota bacterium]